MSFSMPSKPNSFSNAATANAMFQLPGSSPMMAHHHNRDLALQKYFLLHEQQEHIRQHLDELRSHSSYFSPMDNANTAVTPTHISPSEVVPRQQFRSSSIPSMKRSCILALDGTALSEVAAEEAKLCDVNEGLKRALTELLNCDAVRADRAFRTWVQSRLMDTERELRSGRRRRSAPDA